jgi:hypothetical protein
MSCYKPSQVQVQTNPTRVSDPYSLHPDPYPGIWLNPDPDPGFVVFGSSPNPDPDLYKEYDINKFEKIYTVVGKKTNILIKNARCFVLNP